MDKPKPLNKMSKKDLIKLIEEYENQMVLLNKKVNELKFLTTSSNKCVEYYSKRLLVEPNPEKREQYQIELDKIYAGS